MQSITISLVPVLPTLASVATFLVQAFTEEELTPEKVHAHACWPTRGKGVGAFLKKSNAPPAIALQVFTVLALFNVLRFPLAVLPMVGSDWEG